MLFSSYVTFAIFFSVKALIFYFFARMLVCDASLPAAFVRKVFNIEENMILI